MADVTLYTGVDDVLELEFKDQNGVALDTTGWTIHLHLAEVKKDPPLVALSSAAATEIAAVDAAAGRWDAYFAKELPLKSGRFVLKLFGETPDGDRKLLGIHKAAVVEPGWVDLP